MAYISEDDVTALVEACLDDNASIKEMVDIVRRETGDGLLMTCDQLVYTLSRSKHPKAAEMHNTIVTTISRYKK